MKLRKATMEDSDFLLELKNDPIMRKFAVVTHKKIKKTDHEKWLANNIHTISIVTLRGERMGMFRVTDDGEVSINLAPASRGKGIGLKVLKNFCPNGVWAKIVNGNVPSMRLFIKAGFEITAYEKNYYVFKN